MTSQNFKTKTVRRAAMIGLIGTALMGTTAIAADYQVAVRTCPAVKGSLTIDPAAAGAWDAVKSNNPTSVMNSIVAQSNCFRVNDDSGVGYLLRYGPLTPEEYAAGPAAFPGFSVLEPPPAATGGIPQAGGIPQSGGGIPQSGGQSGGGVSLGSVDQTLGAAERAQYGARSAEYYAKRVGSGNSYNNVGDVRRSVRGVDGVVNSLGGLGGMLGSKAPKDRYAYVEVINSAGQVVARGFGQNNRADLSFSNFEGSSSFSKNKKSRRMGGALFNAFNDAQNQILSPSFGAPVQ